MHTQSEQALTPVRGPSRPKRLPYKILSALDAVLEMTDLKPGVRATLRTLCRFLSQHTRTGEVWASRKCIARRAGCSVATVNRHITQLAEDGLLTVGAQGHRTTGPHKGNFTVTHLFIAQDLLRSIGILADDSPASPIEKSAEASLKMQPALTEGTKPSISTRKEHGPKVSEPTLPAELAPLVERGVRGESVCKLMRLARAYGHRLGQVWTAVQARVDALGLTRKRLKDYLEVAITKGVDFAARAHRALVDAERTRQAEADAHELAAFVAAYAGRVFESADRRELVAVAADGTKATHRRGGVDGTVPLSNVRDARYLASRIAELAAREPVVVRKGKGACDPAVARAAIVGLKQIVKRAVQ